MTSCDSKGLWRGNTGSTSPSPAEENCRKAWVARGAWGSGGLEVVDGSTLWNTAQKNRRPRATAENSQPNICAVGDETDFYAQGNPGSNPPCKRQ